MTGARPWGVVLVALAVACARAPSPVGSGVPEVPTRASSPATPKARASAPAYYLVPSDDLGAAVASRRTALRAAGQRLQLEEVGYYMDVQEARLRQVTSSGVSVVRRETELVLSLPGALSFEVGSATLTADAGAALRVLARVFAEYRLSVIAVHGHTDASGDSLTNGRLSEQRALAVAQLLIDAGVSSERLVIAGFGAHAPLASNETVEGREANRRVELHVSPLGP